MSAASQIMWYWDRLRSMGPSEAALRLRSRWLQTTEARAMRKLGVATAALTTAESAFPRLPQRSVIPATARVAIETDVDKIRAGAWEVLRGTQLNVDFPPDWQRDHLSGGRANGTIPSRRLNHRALGPQCDPRMVWELSRFVQIVRLAQRAWLEDDIDAAGAAVELLDDWRRNNPLGVGLNWTSPMEPGIRLINLAWIDALLAATPATGELARNHQPVIAQLVSEHAWWVWRYRSFGSSANNHLLGELAGLIVASARWPEVQRRCTELDTLSASLCDEVLRQFAADGGNREQALHYHLFAWEMCWQAVLAAESVGQSTPQAVVDRLANAGEYFAELVSPEEPWDFGDSDDAHITPVYECEKNALAEWQAWFQHAGEGKTIAAWLGTPPTPTTAESGHGRWATFEESGYAVYRDRQVMLRFDFSPLGLEPMAAHGHGDALHLSLWIDGAAIVIDPGTGAYYHDAAARTYLASRFAHNGPCFVGDSGYPVRRGPFLWRGARGCTEQLTCEENRIAAAATFGTKRIERTVAWDAPGVLSVVDRLEGIGQHQVFWQFAPGTEVAGNFTVRRGDARIGIQVEGACVQQVQLVENRDQPTYGFCSPAFRKYCWAPGILVTGNSGGSAVVTTVFELEGSS